MKHPGCAPYVTRGECYSTPPGATDHIWRRSGDLHRTRLKQETPKHPKKYIIKTQNVPSRASAGGSRALAWPRQGSPAIHKDPAQARSGEKGQSNEPKEFLPAPQPEDLECILAQARTPANQITKGGKGEASKNQNNQKGAKTQILNRVVAREHKHAMVLKGGAGDSSGSTDVWHSILRVTCLPLFKNSPSLSEVGHVGSLVN